MIVKVVSVSKRSRSSLGLVNHFSLFYYTQKNYFSITHNNYVHVNYNLVGLSFSHVKEEYAYSVQEYLKNLE